MYEDNTQHFGEDYPVDQSNVRIEISGLPASGKTQVALKICDMIKNDESLSEKIIDVIDEKGYALRFENGSFSTIIDKDQSK